MEVLDCGDYKCAEELLLKAKNIDSDYVQTYVGLVSVYSRPKDREKAIKNIKIAFEKTQKKFPKWPKRMEWGFLENRAYLRSIQYMADFYWDTDKSDEADELFRLLLKLNPNDNQGVRYEISAMYTRISGKELNKMFDECNKKQNWDKLEKLVEAQNKLHKFWNKPRKRNY
jgi:tetratricopeptide (TPR) repeat protein